MIVHYFLECLLSVTYKNNVTHGLVHFIDFFFLWNLPLETHLTFSLVRRYIVMISLLWFDLVHACDTETL